MAESVTDSRVRSGHVRGRRVKVRGWILGSGAVAGLAIVLASLVVLNPLIATRADLRQVAQDGIPLQAQLIALRTTVVEWAVLHRGVPR